MQHPRSEYYSSEKWSFLAAVPVSELWKFFTGAHEAAPSFVIAVWQTQSIRINEKLVRLREGAKGGERPNPRKTGEMGWRLRLEVVTKPQVVLSEIVNCSGRTGCDKAKSSKGKEACAKSIRWAIFSTNLNEVVIYHRGTHGELFKPVEHLPVSAYLRQDIIENDNLQAGGPGGGTTAAKELQRLQHVTTASGSIRSLPTYAQVKNLLAYERRKCREKGDTQVDILQATLDRDDIQRSVLYPTRNDLSIVESWQAGEQIAIILIPEYFDEIVPRLGATIVGLDAVFKLNKIKWPLYAIVAQDDKGHGWPIALGLLSSGEADIIQHFLQVVKTKARTIVPEWSPIVMIDKDKSERRAVEALEMCYLLCDFHVQQTWRSKVSKLRLEQEEKAALISRLKKLQHARTEDRWKKQLAKLKAEAPSAFYTYFEKHWLTEDWLDAWRDVNRSIQREGLGNTNNVVEALFKKIGHHFLHHRVAKSLDTLLVLLVKGVLAHYNILWAQQRSGTYVGVTRGKRRQALTRERARKALAKNLDDIELITEEYVRFGRYFINVEAASCSCPQALYTGRVCKHVSAVDMYLEMKRGGDDPTFIRQIATNIFEDEAGPTDETLGRKRRSVGAPRDLPPRPCRRPRKNEILTRDVMACMEMSEEEVEERTIEMETAIPAGEVQPARPRRLAKRSNRPQKTIAEDGGGAHPHEDEDKKIDRNEATLLPALSGARQSKKFTPAALGAKRRCRPVKKPYDEEEEEKILSPRKKRHN